jgi:hypothetical protein
MNPLHTCVLKAALAFQERYGVMRYTQANRLVAGDFVRGYLRKEWPDMRMYDRVVHAGYAVEWCFVPLMPTIHAAEIGADPAFERRRGLANAPR